MNRKLIWLSVVGALFVLPLLAAAQLEEARVGVDGMV